MRLTLASFTLEWMHKIFWLVWNALPPHIGDTQDIQSFK